MTYTLDKEKVDTLDVTRGEIYGCKNTQGFNKTARRGTFFRGKALNVGFSVFIWLTE